MSAWAEAVLWVLALLFALAAIAILLLALLHVRYRILWSGTWGGTASGQAGEVRVEFGFPGFMRSWERNRDPEGSPAPTPPQQPSVRPSVSESSAPRPPSNAASSPAPSGRAPAGPTATVPETPVADEALRPSRPSKHSRASGSEKRDPNRWRKALFRLATDGPAWGLLVRYGFRMLRRFHDLLGPRLEVAIGHPDPALLGRLAGHWYAVAPLRPLIPLSGDLVVGFRFQDREPTLHLRAEGGFSALSLLRFGAGAVLSFPFFGLGRRMWYGWRHREMTGWRAWTYRRLQTL